MPICMETGQVDHNHQAIRLERYIYLLLLILKMTPLTTCYIMLYITTNHKHLCVDSSIFISAEEATSPYIFRDAVNSMLWLTVFSLS